MVVVTVPSRLCKVLAKLTVFDRSCLQAGIGTRLVKSNRVEACKHSDIRQDRSIVLPMTVTVRADILYQRDMEARTSIADSLRILRHFPVEKLVCTAVWIVNRIKTAGTDAAAAALALVVVDDSLVKKYLMERLHVPDYQAEIDASFAQGSIGRAKDAATSEEFSAMTENALKILKYVNTMEVYELADEINSLSGEKQNIGDYLDIFQFWFRDVLMFKATQEVDNLVFKQEINYIKEQASQRSYENLEKILEALEKTKVRLRANVNFELALELLFLTIRER